MVRIDVGIVVWNEVRRGTMWRKTLTTTRKPNMKEIGKTEDPNVPFMTTRTRVATDMND